MVETLTPSKIKSYWIVPGLGSNSDITPETLKEAICRVFGTEPDKLQGKGRDEATADAKHFFRWFLSKYHNMSDPNIAMLSNCSRSQVLCSINRASILMEVDKSFQNKANQIIDKWEAGLIRLIEDKPKLEDVICDVFGIERGTLLKKMKRSDNGKMALFFYMNYLYQNTKSKRFKQRHGKPGKSLRQVAIFTGYNEPSVHKILKQGECQLFRIVEKSEIINKMIENNEVLLPWQVEILKDTNRKYYRRANEKYYPNK